MPTPGLDLAFLTVDDSKVTTDLERIKAWSLLIQTAIDDVVTGAVPTGPAGGELSGIYPNPTIANGVIDNANVSNTAAIAYSKLALTLGIVNGDISASAAIAYSKLNLAGSIVNADVATGAAIAYSKLNLTGSVLNADLAGSIAYSKLSLTGAILNADLAGSIAQSKITNLTSDLALLAPKASPALTGTPTAPTATPATNTTQIATTAYADAIAALKANLASPTFTGTPSLPTGTTGVTQTASNNSTRLATTAYVDTADALKANLASPTFTGTPSLPTGTTGVTQTAADSTTKLATTAFVTTADNLKANLASPAFTGSPTAPTQSASDNSTKIATTAYVDTAISVSNSPGCRVYNTGNVACGNNAATAITYDSERYDPDGMHSTSVNTSRITFSKAGVYMITGGIRTAANTTGVRELMINISGTTVAMNALNANATDGGLAIMNISTVCKVTAAQYAELVLYQNSGGSLNVEAYPYSEFAVQYMGAG